MTEWVFAGLALAGFVAVIRQVLIRRLGWRARRSSWAALLVLPLLVCALTLATVLTEWSALNAGGGLALLAFPPFLSAALLIGAVGVGISMLFDPSPDSEL